MIVVEINKEKYFISANLSVSGGVYKKFLKSCIDTIWFDYKVQNGFFEPFLYTKLGKYKMIKLISCDFVPPQNSDKIYWTNKLLQGAAV